MLKVPSVQIFHKICESYEIRSFVIQIHRRGEIINAERTYPKFQGFQIPYYEVIKILNSIILLLFFVTNAC